MLWFRHKAPEAHLPGGGGAIVQILSKQNAASLQSVNIPSQGRSCSCAVLQAILLELQQS